MCPHCKEFEESSGSAMDRLGSEGKARVVYHPIAILDNASTTDYSTRSAAAAACAAEDGKFRDYAKETVRPATERGQRRAQRRTSWSK